MMSIIATCDWPDEYPELLSSLVTLLSSNAPESVHGAMQVFVEFIKDDMTEDQILPVLRQLLPVLLTILGSTEVHFCSLCLFGIHAHTNCQQHSALTRARVISVFRQCISTLYMVKDQHSQAVKEAIDSVLPVWLEAFKVLLNISAEQNISSSNWDDIAVRIQIFKVLSVSPSFTIQ
jgi:importin-9